MRTKSSSASVFSTKLIFCITSKEGLSDKSIEEVKFPRSLASKTLFKPAASLGGHRKDCSFGSCGNCEDEMSMA
jgi:hypothetical protein